MMTFRIDHEPITALALAPQAHAGAEHFRRAPKPVRPAKKWPGPRVVEISNALPGRNPAKTVSDKKTTSAAARSRTAAQKAKGRPASKATKAGRARARTKTAKVLELLKRPGGATLQQLVTATRWQAHSVRGFLSGTLKKKRGLTIESIHGTDGERTYSIKA